MNRGSHTVRRRLPVLGCGRGHNGPAPATTPAQPAAVVLAGLGLRDLLLRPVLRADAQGLAVVSGVRRLHLTWSQVDDVSVVTDRRSPLLQLDLDSSLVVLGRTRLGRSPYEVLEELLPPQTAARG